MGGSHRGWSALDGATMCYQTRLDLTDASDQDDPPVSACPACQGATTAASSPPSDDAVR